MRMARAVSGFVLKGHNYTLVRSEAPAPAKAGGSLDKGEVHARANATDLVVRGCDGWTTTPAGEAERFADTE